ncbi:MAG TPA: thioredoxin-disulfide reductase, partial [bacterium]|nr:thioredoxin-disulfide reductase [bacterium]
MDKPFIINTPGLNSGPGSKEFDVIIIGGGPGGLSAALYMSRGGMKTAVIEKLSLGGQIFLTAEIENYPGIEFISGPDLVRVMETQAEKHGTEFIYDEVVSIKDEGQIKAVETASGAVYKASALIVATGAAYREIGVPGEAKFRGKGVSNCATCDGAFYKGKEAAVIGGGDTAVEEAGYLTRFASRVHVIHRRDRLRAAKTIQDKAFANEKISFILDSVVTAIFGDRGVEGVRVKNVKTGKESEIRVDGVFIYVGLVPLTGFLKGYIDLDEQGYVITDNLTGTSKEGVFACGDCIQKDFRQAITAASDGANAANRAQHYIERLRGMEYK